MRHIHKENLPEEVFIRNTSAKKSLVVLLPVTRVGEVNIRNWERILQVIAKSEVMALVVLDKTPSAEATEFFSNHENLIKSDIYLALPFSSLTSHFFAADDLTITASARIRVMRSKNL